MNSTATKAYVSLFLGISLAFLLLLVVFANTTFQGESVVFTGLFFLLILVSIAPVLVRKN